MEGDVDAEHFGPAMEGSPRGSLAGSGTQDSPNQADRPVSGDADNQPEKWKAALWRAGGWTHKGSAGAATEGVAPDQAGSACGSSADGDKRQLEQIIALLGFGKFQERSLLILICMQLADGFEATLWWTFEPVVRETWHVAHVEYRIGCCLAASCLGLGSFWGGRLADEHGRHLVLFFAGAAYLCAAFLSCFSFNQWCLLVLRCMCSAALGCRLPASMALAAELLPCTWRARGVILLTSVGAPLGGVFALIFWRLVDVFSDGNPDHAWRLVLGFCCLLDGIVFYFFRNHMAESPFFLRQQGRVRECSALLTEVAEINELVLPDDDMPISSQTEPEDVTVATVLATAKTSSRYMSAVLWLASAVGVAVMTAELVEDEGVVFNQVGSLGSLLHVSHVAMLYVIGAYLSLAVLELPRAGFRGSLVFLLLPGLMLASSCTLVPPSQGSAAFIVGVLLAALLITISSLAIGMLPLTTTTASRGATLGLVIAAAHLLQAATFELVLLQSPHVLRINLIVVLCVALSLAAVLRFALSSDGGDSLTLGALDLEDHQLCVMQGGAAGKWVWGIEEEEVGVAYVALDEHSRRGGGGGDGAAADLGRMEDGRVQTHGLGVSSGGVGRGDASPRRFV